MRTALMSVDLEERGNDTKIGFKHACACVLDVTSLGYDAVGFTGE
jgi:hypothetical protein